MDVQNDAAYTGARGRDDRCIAADSPVGNRVMRVAAAARAGRGAMLPWLLIASPAFAQERPALNAPAQQEAPVAFPGKEPAPELHWGVGHGKSFAVPAYEIIGEEVLLNRVDHYTQDEATYPSMISNFQRNFHKRWVVDNDKFSTNQFSHPYQGTIYQGFARSAGLDFWESSAYTMGGSLLWEYAGESTLPSINDQVATGIGGLFLGEPLFRMASLLLENSAGGSPGLWRELGAAALSPATGLNRLAFGDRFGGVFPSYSPAIYTRLDVGASLASHYSSNVNANAGLDAPAAYQIPQRHEASAGFTIAYGLPGKPDYEYTRPFDYFNLEFVASTSNTFESIFSRGLLVGTTYELGPNYRGIWGLYGIYNYAAPQIFRVSNTGAALGTTGQWWMSRTVALQGTGLFGLGYGGGGVIHGSGIAVAGPLGEGQRNYHYGMTPQAALALRLIVSDRVFVDATGRDFYISRVAASESTGSENIGRGDIAVTIRVYHQHGITLRYAESSRIGTYAGLPTSRQHIGTISIGYTLLGQTRGGAVDWRPPSAGGPDPSIE